MNTYQKKAVFIQAEKWDGSSEAFEKIKELAGPKRDDINLSADKELYITTLEGVHKATLGDMIIRGVEGEMYPCKPQIFEKTYLPASAESNVPASKTLHNTTSNGARKNVPDLVIWGDGDMFKLLCKASSENEGWMKSTKAMEIEDVGCVVQVTTQQRNPDGSYAITDSVTFVPEAKIEVTKDGDGKITSRKLVRNR